MKNNSGLCSIELNIPTTATNGYHGYAYPILNVIIWLFAAFSLLILLNSPVLAENTSGPGGRDLSKKLKKELRAEKQSTRALNEISNETMNLFKEDFPDAQNIAWSVPGDYIEADYTDQHGKYNMVFFDFDNHPISKGYVTDFGILPAKALKTIAKDYKGYIPERTIWYDDEEDNDSDMDLLTIPVDTDSYFTMLKKGSNEVVLQVDTDGEVSFWGEVK